MSHEISVTEGTQVCSHPGALGVFPTAESRFVVAASGKLSIVRVLTDLGEADVADLPRSREGRPTVFCPFCGREGVYLKRQKAERYLEHFSHGTHQECVPGDLADALHARAIALLRERIAVARREGKDLDGFSTCGRCQSPYQRPLLRFMAWDEELVEIRVATPMGYRVPDLVLRKGGKPSFCVEVAHTSLVDGRRLDDLVQLGVPGVEVGALALVESAGSPILPLPRSDWNVLGANTDYPICPACRRVSALWRPITNVVRAGVARDPALVAELGRFLGLQQPELAQIEHLSLVQDRPEALRSVDAAAADLLARTPTAISPGLRKLVQRSLGWTGWGIWRDCSLEEVLTEPFRAVYERMERLVEAAAAPAQVEDESLQMLSWATAIAVAVDISPVVGRVHGLAFLVVNRAFRCGSTIVPEAEVAREVGRFENGLVNGEIVLALRTPSGGSPIGSIKVSGELCFGTRGSIAVERKSAALLASMAATPLRPDPQRCSLDTQGLTPDQRIAVETAWRSRVSLLTGGPGSGKTYTVGRLVAGSREGWFALAPTWKAVSRLRESLGEAQPGLVFDTVAGFAAKVSGRLPNGEHNFRGGRLSARGCNVVVDEAGCIGSQGFLDLLCSLDGVRRLVIVGDPNQLPSVEPGAVLRDLMASRAAPHVHLEHNIRSASPTGIPALSASIRDGGPLTWRDRAVHRHRRDGDVIDEVSRAYGKARKTHEAKNVQVLSPFNWLGRELNSRLQREANPGGRAIFGGLRIGDPVVVTFPLGELVKGDTGVLEAGSDGFAATLRSGDKATGIVRNDVEALELAYCLTVHKSQGSEWPVVIVAVCSCKHDDFLDRSLIYTAVTRASSAVLVVGPSSVIETAVQHAATDGRRTALHGLLQKQPRRNRSISGFGGEAPPRSVPT